MITQRMLFLCCKYKTAWLPFPFTSLARPSQGQSVSAFSSTQWLVCDGSLLLLIRLWHLGTSSWTPDKKRCYFSWCICLYKDILYFLKRWQRHSRRCGVRSLADRLPLPVFHLCSGPAFAKAKSFAHGRAPVAHLVCSFPSYSSALSGF